MQIEIETNINKLKTAWTNNYFNNKELSPYQSFECNKYYFDTFYLAPSRWGAKPIFYRIIDNEKNEIIIPLIKKGKKLFDFCSFSSLDYWDCISPPPYTIN